MNKNKNNYNQALPLLLAAILCVGLSACTTVTIRDKGLTHLASEPNWSDSKPFYLWGLVGTAHVDVKQVCNNRKATQLQTQRTFVDGLLWVVTIGIYAPNTAKVWCGE